MSEMPGQRELLNICFGCLRYSRLAQNGPALAGPAGPVGNLLLSGGAVDCSQCRSASSSGPASAGTQQAKDAKEDGIAANPFYEKYKKKLQHLADEDPEEFKTRLEMLEEKLKPQKISAPADVSSQVAASQALGGRAAAAPQPIPQSASYTAPKGLESVMKLELVQDKSPVEIEQIWKDYHKTKDGVFAVVQKDIFEDLQMKAKQCPTFVFPLPRDDGFEFILMQFDGNDVQFTPLSMYQMLKENAPSCLTLVHYTELLDSKGIVLMSGQYDDKVLKPEDAVMLVQMIAIYYGKNSPRFDQVETFNHRADQFDYNQLIEECKSLYMDKPAVDPSQRADDTGAAPL